MNYLLKSRTRNNYSKKIIGLLVLFVAAALLFSFLDGVILRTISPLWRAENSVSRSLGKTIDFFRTRQSLINENIALKEKVASLELERSALSLTRDQEGILLDNMGMLAETGGVLAAILTHPPQSPYDLIVIDAGSDDSIIEGQRVSLPEGPELGVVSEVFPSFSKVKLFTTPDSKTDAVLERFQVPVTLEGIGAGNFKIVVPRDTEVMVGDRIISPDLSASLMAIVEEIKIEPTDSFKEILARSPANIFSVRFVSIRP